MKKIYYLISLLFLGGIMFINLNLTLNDASSKLVIFNMEALGQIYDFGDIGESTITCAASESKCFTSNGCRCYNSGYGRCPKCDRDFAYFCRFTGYKDDICGMFELSMQNFPGTHKSTCPYN